MLLSRRSDLATRDRWGKAGAVGRSGKDLGVRREIAWVVGTGAAVGLVAGSALEAPRAVCALIRALAAKLKGADASSKRLEVLGTGMQAGSAAVVAAVEYMWVEVVR